MFCARSMMRTGSPMSSTKTWPRPPIAPACTTSETASGIVMKYRVISGWVTVTGPPRSICLRKIGITLPDELSTLPKRTATNRVATSRRWPNDSTIHSQSAFDWPITVFGLTALSVEMKTNRSTPNSAASSTRMRVPDHVVAHRLERMRLQHRDVLVRRGVEDDGRLVLLEDLAPERLSVLDVDELRQRGGEAALADELALDLEERPLGVVDEDQPRRAHPRDLAAELRADRAARTGDEHGVPFEVAGDLVEVDLHLLAAEHVLHLHRADLAGETDLPGDQLVEPRQRLHDDAQLLRRLDDAAAHLARDGRHRDQQLVGPVLAQDARQLVESSRGRARP